MMSNLSCNYAYVSEPNSEYVISVRAFNDMGDGQPAYESNRTREESTPEPSSPLIPPVGLKAIVLSATSVVVYWTDTTLSQSQVKDRYAFLWSPIQSLCKFFKSQSLFKQNTVFSPVCDG